MALEASVGSCCWTITGNYPRHIRSPTPDLFVAHRLVCGHYGHHQYGAGLCFGGRTLFLD